MFEKVIGNDKIKEILSTSIQEKKTSHSYMFVGIEGIGKKLFAKEFAQKLLCLNPNKEETEKCKSCIEFESGNHPDFEIIEPDGNSIKIEQIRLLQKNIQEKPIISDNKVYIIDNADKMTVESQNCLLKTLEEPPEFTTLILIGSNENSFLDTIKSRCIILRFNPISDEGLAQYIKTNLNVRINSQETLKIFQGSIGKLLHLKDKIEEFQNIGNIMKSLDKKDLIDIVSMSKIIYESKDEIFYILDYINTVLLELSKSNFKFANCINIVEETKERIKNNGNYDMCIDNMLFNIWREVN